MVVTSLLNLFTPDQPRDSRDAQCFTTPSGESVIFLAWFFQRILVDCDSEYELYVCMCDHVCRRLLVCLYDPQ